MLMRRKYYYINRDDVRTYEYDGPSEIFDTYEEARKAAEARKADRIAELRRELAELESES